MLFKNAIILYKTPLDSEYKNVYDDYVSQSDYITFLNNFDHVSISLPQNGIRSRKNFGDLFEIVVDGYDSMYLHDYNYMKFITSNNEQKYAFILSIESLNDSETTPACLLKCKLDAWSNNYTTLKNSYTVVKCNRATVDTNKYPNLPSSYKVQKLTPKKKILKFIQSNNDTFCVLWQRITVSTSPVDTNPYPPNNPITLDGYVGTGGTMVLFRPSAILTNDNGTLRFMKDGRIDVRGLGEDRNPAGILLSQSNCIGIPSVAVVTSSIVISNTLTYTVPFEYTITANSIGFAIDLRTNVTSRVYGIDGDSVENSQGISVVRSSSSYDIVTAKQVYTFGTWFTPVEYVYDGVSPKLFTYTQGNIFYDSNKRDLATKTEAVKNEILFNEYPYKYYSLYIGANEIPFVGFPSNFYSENGDRIAGLKINIFYDCYGKYGACIKVSYENENNFVCMPINSLGEMDIKYLAYDEYMMRNQSAFTLSVGSGILKGLTGLATAGISAATGNVFGVLAGAGTAFSSTSVLGDLAKINDLKNTPPSVNSEGIYPQTSPYQLDLICIVENITDYDDEFTESDDFNDNLIYGYHMFGDDSGIIQSLTKINRDYFDYLDGNVALSACVSEEDKKELISAIGKGITKWHIRPSVHTSNRSINTLKYMNKNVVNYPISLIP